jgi:hypothetical protein
VEETGDESSQLGLSATCVVVAVRPDLLASLFLKPSAVWDTTVTYRTILIVESLFVFTSYGRIGPGEGIFCSGMVPMLLLVLLGVPAFLLFVPPS